MNIHIPGNWKEESDSNTTEDKMEIIKRMMDRMQKDADREKDNPYKELHERTEAIKDDIEVIVNNNDNPVFNLANYKTDVNFTLTELAVLSNLVRVMYETHVENKVKNMGKGKVTPDHESILEVLTLADLNDRIDEAIIELSMTSISKMEEEIERLNKEGKHETNL